MLLLRQGDAGNACTAHFGKIEGEPAPARTDVEYVVIVSYQKLGREMPLLGELRVVERLIGIFEIGAAVLPVGIEKKRVELPVEIIMMRHVAPSP